MHWSKLALLSLCMTTWASCAHADASTSLEYKALLNPARFAAHPDAAANSFLIDLNAALNASNVESHFTGHFVPHHERTIRFYDAQGSCPLFAQSYSLRERIDKKRELTLKFRTTSESAAAAVHPIGTLKQSKFEIDKTASAETYSSSAKRTITQNLNLNSLQDIKHLYPNATGLHITENPPLSIVSGLTIWEKTYSGPSTVLEQQNIKLTLSLWYLNTNDTPAVAEASFVAKYDQGVLTSPATQSAEQLFNTLTHLNDWIDTQAIPKTAWVYQYDPAFCDTDAHSNLKNE